VAAIAGIASILLRSRTTAGQIIVSATSGSMTGSDTVTSHEPPTTGISDPFTRMVVRVQPVSFAIRIRGSELLLQVPSDAVKQGGAAFTLCNAQGRVVGRWNLTGSSTSVNIKSLPHGIYMGQITGGADRYVRKLVW
jgi:hypothetical protein